MGDIAPDPVADEGLVEQARSGDEGAYAQLIRRYAGIAMRAASVIGPASEADDVVQESFVKAYFALDQFRVGADFQPWLLAIVANTARNRHRSAGRRLRLLARTATLEPVVLVPSAETSAVTEAQRQQVLAAVNGLPEKDRLVVCCRYLLELSEAETAQVLGWPAGSVKSRLSRALKKLRSALTEEGQTVA